MKKTTKEEVIKELAKNLCACKSLIAVFCGPSIEKDLADDFLQTAFGVCSRAVNKNFIENENYLAPSELKLEL